MPSSPRHHPSTAIQDNSPSTLAQPKPDSRAIRPGLVSEAVTLVSSSKPQVEPSRSLKTA